MTQPLLPRSPADTNPAALAGGIAIVGVSGRYPGGATNPDLLWRNLCNGVDAIGEAKGDRWDLGWHHPDSQRRGRVYTRAGGFLERIDGFDAEFFGMSPREVKQVDPQQRLLLELAWEALEDAGIAPRSQAGSETGVFVGISAVDYANLDGSWPDAYSNTGGAFSIAANRISYIFDFHGPSVAMDTACSSSLVGVHHACRSLLNGECTMALAGGVHLMSHIHLWQGFAKASMLSPTGRCKSFDASGDGYVRSEGGGLVLLKPLAAAVRDGNRILGVIVGSGVNSDGRTMGLSLPNGDAQEQLLRTVYSQCQAKPEDVFYVEAHGTGTAVGDPIECGALGRVLGAPRADGSRCLIGSVKSNIGHLEAASGIAGLTKAVLSLHHREIPANLHFVTPNPKIDFENWKLEVVTKPQPLPERDRPYVFGVNSFGFGGTNAHVAIQEYRQGPLRSSVAVKQPATHQTSVLILTAQSEAALKVMARNYAGLLENNTTDSWEDICAGTATSRSPMRYRLALAAGTRAEAAAKLENYLADKPAARLAAGNSASAIALLAFVYSGNGPQWWGMGRELLAENETFRRELEAVDAIFAPLAGWSLLSEMRQPESESRIALTEVAQPMLFALQLGLTQVLRASGINAMAVLGHSVGEAAAAWASGALTREQATQVIFHRSAEQAKTAGSGKMAALGIGPGEALKAIGGIPGWLELAAINSPQSVTVAGDPEALEKLVQAITVSGKFARLLQLNYPFHTKAMEPIRAGLLESLKELKPQPEKIAFISTVDGVPKPGQDLSADYWYRNVREPVRFSDAIGHLLKETGVAVFLEIGPHPVLKDYVAQSAKALDSSAVVLQTLRRPGSKGPEPEADNLWTAICACHAYGASDPSRLFERPWPMPKLPLYPWQHSRHWRGHVPLPEVFSPAAREQALLGHRVPAADGLWENDLDLNRLPYLKDHVVQGSVLFPAAGYLELMFSAAHRTLGNGVIDIEDTEIMRPLTISGHGDPIIQTYVNPKDGEVEVCSRADRDSADWTRHARSRVSRRDPHIAGEPTNLAEISARMPHAISADEHYARSSARGLDYGPGFQGVCNVLLTAPMAAQREALADISLPFLEGQGLDGYVTHPAMLDSCVQVLITLVSQNDKGNSSTIPVHMGRVRSIAPLPSRIFCHVSMRSESARSAVADFRVVDPAGNLLLSIDEARCQKVDFLRAAPSPLISEWWRPDAASVLAEQPALPELASIKTSLEPELAQIAAAHDRAAFYRDIRPLCEKLASSYAARAVQDLSPGDAAFDVSRLARRAGVKRDQMALLETVIAMATKDGYLVKTGSSYRSNTERQPAPPEGLWRELFEKHPRFYVEWLLAAAKGDQLAAQLRGEGSDTNATALLEQAGDTSPMQAPYNQIVRATLEKLIAAWPAERPLRILELGAAGGGLTAWLLPVLPAARTDYVFTDPSEAALGRAEHRFAGQRALRFSALDLTRDFVEQGQAAGYYDLVLGANVLSALKEPRELLDSIKKIMAPGGLLLAIEASEDNFQRLVFDRKPAMWLDDLASAGFAEPVILDDSSAGQPSQQSVYLTSLNSIAVTPITATQARRRWLLVVEDGSVESTFSESLAQHLASLGQDVVQGGLESAQPFDEVVYLSALPHANTDLLATQTKRCLGALRLVQQIEASKQAAQPCHLTLISRGAFPTANGQASLDPGQATLWGLGRVIANEHSSLEVRLIDLHAAEAGSPEASWLAAELLRRDAETEVQLRAGYRYANRTRTNSPADLSHASANKAAAFALDFQPHAGLDSLYLREAERTAPGPDQVEIAVEAAGLNFRDVLWVMGMLPEEAVEHGFSGPTIGMECSGRIARVGSQVTDLKVGDRVVAFASNCFGSHVTTGCGAVAVIPATLDLVAAATIPTAFLTAYYAFDYLARLEAGETVLIHGAAGGVGMAAIQIAKLKGAKVIGTAGSVRKRRMLEMLGVDHVLNSRSLEFADEVMKITGGVGVDVVLNSLAGEAITKSLQCLRPFGRFLEIGKRDLYGNSQIGLRPFRNNLSYFGIDADTLIVERAALARTIFKKVVAHFAAGELRPIPFQAIPVSRAAEAFRAMQQSRHVGKLVVTMQADPPASLAVVRRSNPIKAQSTYLITGGLGGFGLATAEWLVEQGATSLALLGRRGAVTEEAIAGIARLEKLGATVRPFAVDVADNEGLLKVLAVIRVEMPPLTGIIHAAAVIEDAPILNIGQEQLERVFSAKILGAWNLHRATVKDPLDMFVLYSSSSALVGNPGQGAYVAANLYLDALAHYRRSQGLPALSIGWGAIKDAGFLTRHEAVAGMLKTRTGLDATPAHDALADLGRLSAAGATCVSVGRFDLQRLTQLLPSARAPRFFPIVPKGAAASLQTEETLLELIKKTPEAGRRALILARIREHGARTLGTTPSQINLDQPLAELGLDSLMAVELASGLERDLGQPVSVMQMLSAGSLSAIADLVMNLLGIATDSDSVATPLTQRPIKPQSTLQELKA